MAIATLADYQNRMRLAKRDQFYKPGATAAARLSSTWVAVPAGVTPSTAAACNKSTVGAINFEGQIGEAGLTWCIGRAATNASVGPGNLILCDRLSHTGGLSGTVTGAQTTNLPTAALTRYTDGAGVLAALEIYTAVGTTATVARISYTNQDGTAGQVSKDVVFGATGNNAAQKFIIMPLADGDTGVRSVESVTLDASTVSSAGNFGVTLFKPLAYLQPGVAGTEAYGTNTHNALIGGCGQFEPIAEQACLFALHNSATTNVFAAAFAYLDIT